MRTLPILLLLTAACGAVGGADDSKSTVAAGPDSAAPPASAAFTGKPSDKPSTAAADSGVAPAPGEARRPQPIPESELGEFTPVVESEATLEEIHPVSSGPDKPARAKP